MRINCHLFLKGIKGVPGPSGQKGDLGEDGPRVRSNVSYSQNLYVFMRINN